MKNIHILNGGQAGGAPEPDKTLVIDEQTLEAELTTGELCFAKVPLSQSHLFTLVQAAQAVCAMKDCPPYTRTLLQDFQLWCARDAQFGPEMRKVLALTQALHRQPGGQR